MGGNDKDLGSDLAKVDAHENSPADYDEIPEFTDSDFARGIVQVAGVSVSRPRGRPSISGGKQQLALRIDRDVIAVFKAKGPGWQSRINEVLRQAAGLETSR